ncbi:hypothetical protein [Parenemella sanctibonifatiensis]|uniref:CRISPR-associated protein Csb3 n=1 Tax=Parenemella sanctibonifatiensis TaxID=2016505 RepID=A0A255EKM4_9ACTN|nr:hypothetical protein [Parenemella sanctibonifatiensis]OYN91531.1 hypothetical protein CGZ92_00345 [Parenemella sanctibonifatiensis]
MKVTLAGNISSALTHLALVGCAAMLTESGASRVRLWWEDGEEASPTLSWDDDSDLGEVVLDHAKRHSGTASWVQDVYQGKGLFTPRGVLSKTEWEDPRNWAPVLSARDRRLGSGLTALDEQMIGNLGEPGHWVTINGQGNPDAAATRWEMKTRNRGEEFIGNRLAPMAAALTSRTPREVEDGLTGVALVDDASPTKPDSRTPTGLTPPRRTDTALAWCALWGISQIRLMPQARAYAVSSGVLPVDRAHPRWAGLPIFAAPVTHALWSRVVASRSFANALAGLVARAEGASEPDGARAEAQVVAGYGVHAVGLFRVFTSDNPNAPERMMLDGRPWILGEP